MPKHGAKKSSGARILGKTTRAETRRTLNGSRDRGAARTKLAVSLLRASSERPQRRCDQGATLRGNTHAQTGFG